MNEGRRFYPPTMADIHGSLCPKPYLDAHRERIRAHNIHDHPESPSMERRAFDDGAWLPVLVEEVGEVSKELCDHRHSSTPDRAALARGLRGELVQVVAMAAAWIDAIDLDAPEPDA